MIKDQIEAIQNKLQNSPNISADTKASLLDLLRELREEVDLLAQTHQEDARKIAGFADASADEAANKEDQSDSPALQALRDSVEGFETSHPKLTNVVSRIATTLSNMGI